MSYRVLDSYDGLPTFRSVDGRKWGVTSFHIKSTKNAHIRKIGEIEVVQFGIEYAFRAFWFQFAHIGFASKRLRECDEWLFEHMTDWVCNNAPCYMPCGGWGDDARPVVVNIE